MKVKVRYFAIIREIVGKREEEIDVPEKTTVYDILIKLIKRYGEKFERFTERETVQFLVNGVSIHSLKGFNTLLKEGDVLAILPPVGGG